MNATVACYQCDCDYDGDERDAQEQENTVTSNTTVLLLRLISVSELLFSTHSTIDMYVYLCFSQLYNDTSDKPFLRMDHSTIS